MRPSGGEAMVSPGNSVNAPWGPNSLTFFSVQWLGMHLAEQFVPRDLAVRVQPKARHPAWLGPAPHRNHTRHL